MVKAQSVSVAGATLALLMMTSGCQSTGPTSAPVVTHTSFDHLWTAYTRCVNSSDLDLARAQAELLHRAAFRDEDARTFLPKTLDRYVETPLMRLAADPRDLARACRSHVERIESAQATP